MRQDGLLPDTVSANRLVAPVEQVCNKTSRIFGH